MRSSCTVGFLTFLVATSSGCTYFENRVDDFADIFTLGVGGTMAFDTPLPPALGVHVELTDFVQAGGLVYDGYMLEVDRRGAGILKVDEARWGAGPYRRWTREETPVTANEYKTGDMPGWEARMASKAVSAPMLRENGDLVPVEVPAKRVRFEGETLGPLARGWQDWGVIGADVAICEPFLLHAGVRLRAGIDISQFADFFLGLFTADFYGDDASEAEYRGLYDF